MGKLPAIDSNGLADLLDGYSNKKLNKALGKFLIHDSENTIYDILEDTDPTEGEYAACLAGIRATLEAVNKVLKSQKIPYQFATFDMVDYDAYVLTATKEKLEDFADRIREQA